MPELRWALLVIGVLFLAGLAWREFRRPRQARPGKDGAAGRNEAGEAAGRPDFALLNEPARDRRLRQEPTLDSPIAAALEDARLRTLELPQISTDDDREADRDIATSPRESQPAISLPVMEMREAPAAEPADDVDPAPAAGDEEAAAREPAAPLEQDSAAELAPWEDAEPDAVTDEAAPPVAAVEDTGPASTQTSAAAREPRVVAVRVVPQPPERFGGRGLLQALIDSGFVFGEFDIFHVTDTSGRRLASAANLMRPGSFDPPAMREQHFHGLKIFVVLPGPLPPVQAVDEMLAAARRLAGKLGGTLLDDLGRPLTLSGLAQIKAELLGGPDKLP